MGTILFTISIILLVTLLFPCFVYGIIEDRMNENKYFLSLAESIDRFGNVLCAPLFNTILINKLGYNFGNPKETISSVLGKNLEKPNTLTRTGNFLVAILNKIQKNHCLLSIDNNV